MLKRTIVYKDLEDVERTGVFYFNINRAELFELETSVVGGFSKMIERLSTKIEPIEVVEIFKKIILMSYGDKSPDGLRFIKSEEAAIAFSQTEAFVELFMELAGDAEKAAEFINAVIPPMIKKAIPPTP